MPDDIKDKDNQVIVIYPKAIESIATKRRARQVPPIGPSRIGKVYRELRANVTCSVRKLCADQFLTEFERVQSIETLSALEKHCDQISQGDAKVLFVNRPNPIRITDRDQQKSGRVAFQPHRSNPPSYTRLNKFCRNLIGNCPHSRAGEKRLPDIKVLHRGRVIRQGDHSILSKQGRQSERLQPTILPRVLVGTEASQANKSALAHAF